MAKTKSKRAARKDAGEPLGRWRLVAAVLTAAAALFVAVSLLSFDRYDAPNHAVLHHNAPTANWGGPAGAHLAYGVFWALGDGAYALLLFLIAGAYLWIARFGVADTAFRIAGAAMLVVAVGTFSAMIQVEARLPIGNGGVLGLVLSGALVARVGLFGAGLFTAVIGLVGLVLLTDLNVFRAPVLVAGWIRDRARGPVHAIATAAAAGAGAAVSAVRSEGAAKPVVRKQKRKADVEEADLEALEDAEDAPDAAEDTLPQDEAHDAEDEEALDEEDDLPDLPKGVVIRHTRPDDSLEHQKEFAFTPLPSTPRNRDYQLPHVDLLEDPTYEEDEEEEARIREKADVLARTLEEFNVRARVVAIETGPVITQYELALAPGVKVSKVVGLSDDLAISLRSPSVRIVAPLPGKNTIGVEVPNTSRQTVCLKEIVLAAKELPQKMGLPLFLGKDATGAPMVKDLASMPHLLIAGTTGSGKSVCLNAIIMSLLLTRTPDDLKLVLIDPKMVEMSVYNSLPHLLCPVVNDMRKAEAILGWLVDKMEERYRMLSQARVRNITGYNRLTEAQLHDRFGAETDEQKARVITHMPRICVVVDEFADLMMVAAKEVEGHVTRLAQKSRAVGIHLVMATQRPSVDVITGLIKSNLPNRVSFQVASRIDSRTILDSMGAEKLLGQGDMLFMVPGAHKFLRAQGAYVSDADVQRMVDFVTDEAEPAFQRELVQMHVEGEDGDAAPGEPGEDLLAKGADDEVYGKAIEIVLEHQRGSVSLLQRRLGIGYGRAARLVDQMAEDGLVGQYNGSQAREVLLTLDQWEAMKARAAQGEADASAAANPLTEEEAALDT